MYYFNETNNFQTLYKVLVRYKLEYIYSVCNDISQISNNNVKGVQRCFLRVVCAKYNLQYCQFNYHLWCDFSKPYLLELRRKNIDSKFKKVSNEIHCMYSIANLNFMLPMHQMKHKCNK